MELSKAHIERFNELADEPIRFVSVLSPEEQDEYNRLHPLPTDEELREILLECGCDPDDEF